MRIASFASFLFHFISILPFTLVKVRVRENKAKIKILIENNYNTNNNKKKAVRHTYSGC